MAELPRIRNPQTQIERRIHRALEKKRESNERPARDLYMSRIGECERLLWAELEGKVPPKSFSPQVLARFELGHAIEGHVISLLRQAGYQVTGEQTREVVTFGLNRHLVGRIDGKILLGEKRFALQDAVLEIKTANRERFDELCEIGYESWNPAYGDTLQMYMGSFNLPVAIALIYCKDNSRLYAEKIRLDRKRYQALLSKAKRALTSKKVLDRPAEAKSEYCAYCKYCSAREWCWSALPNAQFDD